MIDQSYLATWLVAFTLTQITEVPIYCKILRVRAIVAFGASAISHPLLWFVFVPLTRGILSYVPLVIVCESLVFSLEAMYFAIAFRCPLRRSIVASLVANGASVVVGFSSDAIFHWSEIQIS